MRTSGKMGRGGTQTLQVDAGAWALRWPWKTVVHGRVALCDDTSTVKSTEHNSNVSFPSLTLKEASPRTPQSLPRRHALHPALPSFREEVEVRAALRMHDKQTLHWQWAAQGNLVTVQLRLFVKQKNERIVLLLFSPHLTAFLFPKVRTVRQKVLPHDLWRLSTTVYGS